MQDHHKESTELFRRFQAMNDQAQHTFWGYLGCELVSISEDEAVVKLDVQSHHLNMLGIVNGGVTSSLIDNTMGMLTMAAKPEVWMVTTHLNIHYVSPLNRGIIIVRASLIHAGTRTLTCYAEVTDEQGRVGTIGMGTFRAKT